MMDRDREIAIVRRGLQLLTKHPLPPEPEKKALLEARYDELERRIFTGAPRSACGRYLRAEGRVYRIEVLHTRDGEPFETAFMVDEPAGVVW